MTRSEQVLRKLEEALSSVDEQMAPGRTYKAVRGGQVVRLKAHKTKPGFRWDPKEGRLVKQTAAQKMAIRKLHRANKAKKNVISRHRAKSMQKHTW